VNELIVFGGPSIIGIPNPILERITLHPPVKRGDLELLLETKPRKVLIIDGLFGNSLSVTPRECCQLLQAGWMVCGCSSIGALRAAELWSMGMIGFGKIYEMLRTGIIEDDTEVCVPYNCEKLIEVGISFVHLRSVINGMKSLTNDERTSILHRSSEIYWRDRTFHTLMENITECQISDSNFKELARRLKEPKHHPKIQDANHALNVLLADTWPVPVD